MSKWRRRKRRKRHEWSRGNEVCCNKATKMSEYMYRNDHERRKMCIVRKRDDELAQHRRNEISSVVPSLRPAFSGVRFSVFAQKNKKRTSKKCHEDRAHLNDPCEREKKEEPTNLYKLSGFLLFGLTATAAVADVAPMQSNERYEPNTQLNRVRITVGKKKVARSPATSLRSSPCFGVRCEERKIQSIGRARGNVLR